MEYIKKLETVEQQQTLVSEVQRKGSFVAYYHPEKGEYAGKQIIIFGSLHTSYKNGIPFTMIKKCFDQLPQSALIMYESASLIELIMLGRASTEQDIVRSARAVYEPTIWNKFVGLFKTYVLNEMTFTYYVAFKQSKERMRADISVQDTLKAFRKLGYSEQEIYCFGVFLWTTFKLKGVLLKPIYTFSVKNKINKLFGTNIDLPFEAILEFFNFKKGDQMWFEYMYMRDCYAMTSLLEQIKMHDTIFIAYGALHWHLWKDELQEHFGEPTIVYHQEFLKE